MAKINVMVLQGGQSTEHDISLVSARQVASALNKSKYNVSTMTITKEGKWLLSDVIPSLKDGENSANQENSGAKALQAVDSGVALQEAKKQKTDVVFIALHGGAGEDGRIQALLELVGLPYTGSGPLASGLAMNKVRAADMYRANGLHVPYSFNFSSDLWKKQREFVLEAVARRVVGPWVIKPADQGSSVGVSIVEDEAHLEDAIEKALAHTTLVIVQQFIGGTEATCGVLEKQNGEVVALPPTRIIPNKGEFYDYKSKYAAGGSTHVCPADFDPTVNKAIQEAALTAHRALGCYGMSRTDCIIGDDGELYVLETNTIPGMTPTSLLPEAARAAGIEFSEMIDLLIEGALKRR